MSVAKNRQDLQLLLRAGAAQPALAAHLDALEGPGRIEEVRTLSGKDMAALFERCGGAPAFGLLDLVQERTPQGQTTIFAGKNSLPLFTHFEKRFTRLGDGRVVGYNFQQMSWLTGPGYFTVTEATGGELLFDYTQVPAASEAPADWPAVRSNNGGVSSLVYKDLHDFCRRVSHGVVIGRATRLGKPMSQYFILARAS